MSRTKLVAIDIDGTLLDPYGEITPRTKAAMEAVANLDIQIIISTGRRFWTAREKVTPLGLQDLILSCHNGILLKRFNGELLYHCLLDLEFAKSVVAFAKSRGLYPIVFESVADNCQVLVEPFESMKTGYLHDKETIAYLEESQTNTCFFDDLSRQITGKIIEVVCVIPAKETKETSQVFEQRFGSAIKTIVATVPNPNRSFFSVANSQAGKSGPLKFWADQNGIDHRSVLAVGDNYNDLDMLQYAGIGVLMGNADPELQQIGSKLGFELTARNDQDGLATTLEKHLLS